MRRLPEAVALRAGAAVAWLVGEVLGIRRADVDRHLALAFPDRDADWRRRVRRACYRHLGREAVVTLRLADLDPAAVRRRTVVEGLEPVRRALDGGRGALVVTGHLGNWEIGGAALSARGVPVTAVALRQGNPLFDRELVAARERLGLRVVYKKDAPVEVLEALGKGDVVALVGDQNPIRGGIPVEFFGRPANTARGPGLFALRTGAPVFLGVALRSGDDGGYEIRIEEVSVERTGDRTRDVQRIVQAYTRGLERMVRRAPEQYFWQHRRWKERVRRGTGRPAGGGA